MADRALPLAARAAAAADLASAARSRRAYAETAAAEGAAAAATRLVRDATAAGDAAAADAGAALVGAVSGDAAASGGVATLAVGESCPPITIVQASLSDGLGARLWAAAPALIAALTGEAPPREAPVPLIKNTRILELGAGTGAVALAALRLGAAGADVTDCEAGVLAPARASAVASLKDGLVGTTKQDGAAPSCWTIGPAAIHTLTWGKEAEEADAAARPASPPCSGGATADTPCPTCAATGPPPLPAHRRYASILASDVFYESDGCAALAAEIAARLAPGGRALLACPVREACLLERFLESAKDHHLTVVVERADWALAAGACRAGVEAAAAEYEGGFLFVGVKHAGDAEE